MCEKPGLERAVPRALDRANSSTGDGLVKVRRAGIEDALMALDWRNDPLTRAMSRDEAEVPREAHLAWFAAALADPARLLLIGETGGRPAGMARFDRIAGGWDVSINVAPPARGQGVGRALLDAALAAFDQHHSGSTVWASVKPENAPSVRLFEADRFERCGEEDGLLRYRRPAN
jgi:ribosomal protein S18 acetylase RimI-like enzyme